MADDPQRALRYGVKEVERGKKGKTVSCGRPVRIVVGCRASLGTNVVLVCLGIRLVLL